MTVSASKNEESEARAADAALALPVWDLPVRLTHWALVLLIAFSWWSAENEEIAWHLRSGYAILFLLLFRLAWGVCGSSTARFSSFVRGPRTLASYLRAPDDWQTPGHTPLGAVAVLTLLGLIALQLSLGLPLSDEDGIHAGPLNRLVSFETAEWSRDMHEIVFKILLGFIALHVASILFYQWRGKRLIRAMVTGRSLDYPEGTQALIAAGPARLALCLVIAGSVTSWVVMGVPGL